MTKLGDRVQKILNISGLGGFDISLVSDVEALVQDVDNKQVVINYQTHNLMDRAVEIGKLKEQLSQAKFHIATHEQKLNVDIHGLEDSVSKWRKRAESAEKDAEIYYNWFHYELEMRRNLEKYINTELADLKSRENKLSKDVEILKKLKGID